MTFSAAARSAARAVLVAGALATVAGCGGGGSSSTGTTAQGGRSASGGKAATPSPSPSPSRSQGLTLTTSSGQPVAFSSWHVSVAGSAPDVQVLVANEGKTRLSAAEILSSLDIRPAVPRKYAHKGSTARPCGPPSGPCPRGYVASGKTGKALHAPHTGAAVSGVAPSQAVVLSLRAHDLSSPSSSSKVLVFVPQAPPPSRIVHATSGRLCVGC